MSYKMKHLSYRIVAIENNEKQKMKLGKSYSYRKMSKFLLYYAVEFSYTALCILHHLMEMKRLFTSRKHETQVIHRALACSSVPESSSYLCGKVGIFAVKCNSCN